MLCLVNCLAYLGHHDRQIIDIKSLFTTFRRIYKDPAQIHQEDPSVLLDLLTVLALSGTDYKESFDSKSIKYIEECLQILDT